MRLPRFVRELAWPVVAALAFVTVMVWVAVSMASLNHRLDEARADRDQLQAELESQQKTSEALASQVEELGGKPIIDPDDADEPVEPDDPDDSTSELSQGDVALAVSAFCADTGKCRGEAGEPGEDTTPRQVAAAVARYCDATGCQGERGRTGPPPSQETVLAAVQTYCAESSCRGRAGEDGTAGPQGEPGRPPTTEEIAQAVIAYCGARNQCSGPAGRPPTSEEIQQQVQAYCAAHDECRGQPGKDGSLGPPGTDGEDGRSIVNTDCQEDGTWLIEYSDGTSQVEPGPCRVVGPPVDPETQ